MDKIISLDNYRDRINVSSSKEASRSDHIFEKWLNDFFQTAYQEMPDATASDLLAHWNMALRDVAEQECPLAYYVSRSFRYIVPLLVPFIHNGKLIHMPDRVVAFVDTCDESEDMDTHDTDPSPCFQVEIGDSQVFLGWKIYRFSSEIGVLNRHVNTESPRLALVSDIENNGDPKFVPISIIQKLFDTFTVLADIYGGGYTTEVIAGRATNCVVLCAVDKHHVVALSFTVPNEYVLTKEVP